MRGRRGIAGAALVVALGGVMVLGTGTSSAAPQPARQHVTLTKLCPRALMDPTFVIRNVTDDLSLSNDSLYAPEDLLVTLRRGLTGPVINDLNGPGSGDDVLLENVPVAAGQVLTIKAEGELWAGPVYAQFTATYRGTDRQFASKQLCSCEDEDDAPTTTVATTTTVEGGG